MTRLALVEDLRLVFDPSMSDAQLSNNAFYGTDDDTEAIDSTLENAESAFRQRADTDFRLQRRHKFETHDVSTGGHGAYKRQFSRVSTDYTTGRPAEVRLDNTPVLPIDSAEGDAVEIRTAANTWEDVTDAADDEYELISTTSGRLLVYFDRVAHDNQGVHIPRETDRHWVRVRYRYGARGGDIKLGGQTTLDESVGAGDATPSTYAVSNADRLPPAPAVVLVNDSEYLRLSDVDRDNDEVTVSERGLRLTDAVDHTSGDVVHYAPLVVRDAVAKKAAIELTQNDQYSEWLPDTDIPLDAPRKIDEWRNEWQDVLDMVTDG